MRLLIVKTSSMGDVVHALPVVHDILRARSATSQIDWLVESSFAGIARMHPGVNRVLPLAWRRWRAQAARADTWRAMRALRGATARAAVRPACSTCRACSRARCGRRQAAGPLVGYDSAERPRPDGAVAVRAHGRRVAAAACRRALPATGRGAPRLPAAADAAGLRHPRRRACLEGARRTECGADPVRQPAGKALARGALDRGRQAPQGDGPGRRW